MGRKRSVSMMLIELALLCLTRAAFFKRLTLAFARLASVPCQRLRDRRPPRGYVHMISREKLERAQLQVLRPDTQLRGGGVH